MRIIKASPERLKPSLDRSSLYLLIDVWCPVCYQKDNCGFVDGGLVFDGEFIQFYHHDCGHAWTEEIDLSYMKK